MKDFNRKVAVITVAASGIGRALAERCAREGMKVILAKRPSRHLLAERGGKVKVSVLCPGLVQTRIVECGRNRSERLAASTPMDPVEAAGWETLRQQMQTAMPAAHVADAVFQAIREERFYIFTHPEGKEWIRIRMEDILQERNPTLPA